jgi:hypothetical protein
MPGNRPYDNSRHLDSEGIPDLETPLNQDEGMIPPGDHPIAADEFGVTAVEERADEPISERVQREVPNTRADDIDLRDADRSYDDLASDAERIVEPGGEDVDTFDNEKDTIGKLVGEDEGSMSAEEAALHVTDRP